MKSLKLYCIDFELFSLVTENEKKKKWNGTEIKGQENAENKIHSTRFMPRAVLVTDEKLKKKTWKSEKVEEKKKKEQTKRSENELKNVKNYRNIWQFQNK